MRLLVSGATATLRREAVHSAALLGHLHEPVTRNDPANYHLPYAADNGAYSGLDEAAFRAMLEQLAAAPVKPLWVCAPDVVADAAATLDLWARWSVTIAAHGLEPAFVLQDGQESRPLPHARAWFIGGSTRWKASRHVAALALRIKGLGHYLHMGRVNTRRRVRRAYLLGCDSFDGSGFSKWPDTRIPMALRWLKQCQAERLLSDLWKIGPPSQWF